MPYTTTLELKLALSLEYHPHVLTFQRGDMSPTFATANDLFTPLGTPYRISYLYEGKSHDYLPDFVGTLCDGGLLIAEAGRAEEKRKAQPLAKAEAAQRLAHLKGGVYWIATEENFLNAAIIICCICMRAVNPFRPTMRLRQRCWRIGPGVICAV